MIEQAFGIVLKDFRNQRKISQEKLAELCNLDRTFISLLERGQRQPTLTTIFKIAEALQVSPSNLISKVQTYLEKS